MRSRIMIILGAIALLGMIGCHNDNTSVLDTMVADRNLGSATGITVFSGNVLAKTSNAPVVGATVTMTAGLITKTAVSGTGGYFYFQSPLNAGDYTLKVESSGFSTYEKSISFRQVSRNDVLLTSLSGLATSQAGSVSGIVTDSFKRPMSGVKVSLDGVTAYTNTDGLYYYSGVSAGNHNLTFTADGRKTVSLPIYTTGAESYSNASVKMENRYTEVALQAIDTVTGIPLEGVEIIIEGSNVAAGRWYTDRNGMVYISSLIPEKYTLLLLKTGYYNKTDSMDLSTASGDLVRVIRMDPEKSSLKGKVVDPAIASGLERVTVQLSDGSVSTISGALGDFVLRNIPAGDQTVLFQRANYDPVSVKLRFSAGEAKVIADVEMVNTWPTARLEGEVYTESEGKYSYLSVDRNLVSLRLYRLVPKPVTETTSEKSAAPMMATTTDSSDSKTTDNYEEIAVDISTRFNMLGYRYEVTGLYSGVYMAKATYVETVGTASRAVGEYQFNDTGDDTFFLEEGKSYDLPLILKQYVPDTGNSSEVTAE